MTTTSPPAGLYYSERKLWESCPEAHDVLERLLRYRQALKVLIEERPGDD